MGVKFQMDASGLIRPLMQALQDTIARRKAEKKETEIKSAFRNTKKDVDEKG